jgi:hypothetical protein
MGPATLHFWELASAKERETISFEERGASAYYRVFAFTPDGRILVGGRGDRTFVVWDVATGKELLRRADLPAPVIALALSADGKLLATGHSDSTILIWDMPLPSRRDEPPPREPDAKELDAWWSALAGDDARAAASAVWKMAAAPRQVVSYLRQRLRPAPAVAVDEVRRLLSDLDSDDFARREVASTRLAKLGEQVMPALEAGLKEAKSAELRRRIKDLLPTSQVVRSPEVLRAVRAIEVLEHIGTAEARQVLQTLAGGAAAARLTKEAQASLQRLANRSNAAY